MPLTLAFMGTPDFSVPTLKALVDAGHRIRRVYTQPPRPAGRGQQERPTPVHRAAQDLGLDVVHPESLRDAGVLDSFRHLGLDAAVVVAYGLILPKPYLEAPTFGCLNIHASLLPRWRGAAPIQRAILAGDAQTGISIMQMGPGLDDGPVILEEPTPITAQTTAGALHDELSQLGARLLLEALDGLQAGTLHPKPQPDEGVTYAPKLEKAEGLIDWSESAVDLDRRVRALTPWPGCFFEREADGGERARIKLIAAKPAAHALGRPAAPGTILDRHAVIACGKGALRLERVQRPGRKPVSGEEFLRGERLGPGDAL
ncbi:MAG: methionyl-tRNA formyltransferase [Marivibrio sp.]|uniref:methionyl-tRNA formyltransferase n=1 Tax=Marivibrio sp. TaxID=2039719 RepID=UPI0032EC7093